MRGADLISKLAQHRPEFMCSGNISKSGSYINADPPSIHIFSKSQLDITSPVISFERNGSNTLETLLLLSSC